MLTHCPKVTCNVLQVHLIAKHKWLTINFHTKEFIQKFQSYLSIKASTSPLGQPTGHLIFWRSMHSNSCPYPPLPSPLAKVAFKCCIQAQFFIEWIFVWSQMLQNLGKPHISFWHHRIGSFACKHHSNFFLAICAQKQTLCLFTPLYLKHTHSTGSNFPLHPGMVQIPHPQGTGLKHSHAHW